MIFYQYDVGPFVIRINYDLSTFFFKSKDKNTENEIWTIIIDENTDYYNYFQNYKLPFHTSEYDCAYNTEIFYEINYITKRILVKCTSVYNFVNTFFNLPLQYMCLNEKMFLLHAMGVLDSSNKVALFIGESGVGKSSLLNNLLKTYSFFCDDTAILQICKDTFIVWPTSTIIKISLTYQDLQVPVNDKGKSILSITQLNKKTPQNEPRILDKIFYLARDCDSAITPITSYYTKHKLLYNGIYGIQNMQIKRKETLNSLLISRITLQTRHFNCTLKNDSNPERYVTINKILEKYLGE